jgi:protein phosphatase
VQPEARKPLIELARRHHVLAVALVLNMPEALCHERNRDFGPHVVRNQRSQLRRGMGNLQREGFRYVHVLNSPERCGRR